MKHYLFFAVLMVIISGCRPFSGADYLPYGHPADPASHDGKPATLSSALTPQNENVRPEVSAAIPPKTVAPGSQNPGSPTMSGMSHRGSH